MTWSLHVRDADYNRIGQIDGLVSLEATERHLGLGAWVLTVPMVGAAVDLLLNTPGVGIEVRDNGRTVFSGPARAFKRTRGPGVDLLEVRGNDDMLALYARVVHPEPTTATPPFSTNSHDTHTGPASTVLWQFINRNTGPGALTAREWPGLTMATDPAEGPTITVSGRWQNLLAHVAAVASPNGMSVLVRQVLGGLVCTVREQRDKTDVEVSPRAGTLPGWVADTTAPEMTAGWAGGQGDLEARAVVQDSVTPPAAWPLRIERFVDHSNVEDSSELDRVLDEELVEHAGHLSLSLEPSDGLAAKYGHDFDLGDQVAVVIEGVRTVETVTASTLLFNEGVVSRTFNVGPEQLEGMGAVFAQLRRLGTRVRTLEGT